MTANFVISFFESAIGLAAMLTLPALGLGMFVGLMVSIFQAVTKFRSRHCPDPQDCRYCWCAVVIW